MNRKNNRKKEQMTGKAKIFWGSIFLITLAFFVVIAIKWVSSSQVITDYSGMEHLEGEELFKQADKTKDGKYTYYVLVYGSASNESYSEDVSALEEHVANYLNFVKKNKNKEGVLPLYGFDLDNSNNEDRLSSTTENIQTANYQVFKVKADSLPILLKVEITVAAGKTTTENKYQYTDSNAIKEILQRQIDKLS